jgi:hypothetical protein
MLKMIQAGLLETSPGMCLHVSFRGAPGAKNRLIFLRKASQW